MVVPGKQHDRVRARSVLACWAILDLGLTETEVGKCLGLNKFAVSHAATKDQKTYRQSILVPEGLETRNCNPGPFLHIFEPRAVKAFNQKAIIGHAAVSTNAQKTMHAALFSVHRKLRSLFLFCCEPS